MLYRFVYHVFAPLMVMPFLRLFNRLEITGLEHIPGQGPLVVIGNHISLWDPVILYCLIRRRAYFMAKSELFDIPVLGFLLRRINVFPVKRDSIDRNAIKKADQVLAEGSVLALFPEGHRSKSDGLLPFKQGAALFAHRARAEVVPVLFEGTPKAFPKSVGRTIRVKVGAPIDLRAFRERKTNAALLEEMTGVFVRHITDLREEPGQLER